MKVVAVRTPLSPCHWSYSQRIRSCCSSGIEIIVPVDFELVIAPEIAEQGARIEVNDVGFEAETQVVFSPGPLQLVIAPKGKDIIPEHIRLSKMLMKTPVGIAINHVAHCEHAARA